MSVGDCWIVFMTLIVKIMVKIASSYIYACVALQCLQRKNDDYCDVPDRCLIFKICLFGGSFFEQGGLCFTIARSQLFTTTTAMVLMSLIPFGARRLSCSLKTLALLPVTFFVQFIWQFSRYSGPFVCASTRDSRVVVVVVVSFSAWLSPES